MKTRNNITKKCNGNKMSEKLIAYCFGDDEIEMN